MKRLLLIAMLGMSLGAAAQNYGDTYTIDRGGKSCSEWVSQFTSEVQLLESEVSSLKVRVKTTSRRPAYAKPVSRKPLHARWYATT